MFPPRFLKHETSRNIFNHFSAPPPYSYAQTCPVFDPGQTRINETSNNNINSYMSARFAGQVPKFSVPNRLIVDLPEISYSNLDDQHQSI